jgi:RNA polymerase sigma-70 factor (sigma-E family)
MTVTVACRPAPWGAGPLAASGGGSERFVHAVPGDGAPDAAVDAGVVLGAGPGDAAVSGEAAALYAMAAPDAAELVHLDADAAVAVLYRSHWTTLVRLASLLTRDASVAEEIVQDAFVQLHQRWKGLSDRAAAHAYLRTSVVNRARSALRHRGVEERYRQPGAPAPAGPEERAVQADIDARVSAALRTLSRRQQEVLVLRYYGDYSEQDIAATLGLSKGAVKSHAHRGLAALRTALDAAGDLPGGEVPR